MSYFNSYKYYQPNHTQLSHRCPLNDGGFGDKNIFFREWIDSHKKTPARLRCKGMQGVCMMLGALIGRIEDDYLPQFSLVFIDDDSCEDYTDYDLPLANFFIGSRMGCARKFTVPRRKFR